MESRQEITRMNTTRRTAIKTLVAAGIAPVLGVAAPSTANAGHTEKGVNIIMPRSSSLDLKGSSATAEQIRLTRAVLDYVEANYKGRNLPIWGKPHNRVDLEKRVSNICYWIIKSVRKHSGVHYVDPAWVAGQIMAESFFYEFAISRAFAVGICQFIGPTARSFGMTTAGGSPEHGKPPHKKAEYAHEIDTYYSARAEWKKAIRKRRAISGSELDMLRQALADGLDGKPHPKAKQFLEVDAMQREKEDQVQQARKRFRAYLKANFDGRSIFNDKDVAFFKGFEERVLYKTPIDAMVLMLARHLRARSGNILAAAAGYHAGLSTTRERFGVYKDYGRIPPFGSTVSYVSRLVVNHHEIRQRMG